VVVLKTGILNPAINSLISRIRHTNTLVIADRGFPFWPQIETIDMARRGVHNQAAELLVERLDGKIEVDFDTARRLFTLICVLQLKG